MSHLGFVGRALGLGPILAAGWTLAAQTPSGDVPKGRKLYDGYGCYQCHGRQAQGASATGPRLAPNPIAWAVFARYVRQPTGQMPPYTAKVASDQDLADIYAFLRSIPQPAPAKSIPQLSE
jgi:ubiquinol-cytochrome c reductase cytochrome c subunit